MRPALPVFPRIPHLVATSAATRSDRLLDAAARAVLLREPVVVEEKIDGANVMLALDGEDFRVGTRGGEATMDRGGIRARLRGWAWDHFDVLRSTLEAGEVLYAEWIAERHTVAYTRPPGDLVVLDIRDVRGRFLSAGARDARCGGALPVPPRLFEGVLGSVDALVALAGPSRFGAPEMEGLVVRLEREGALVQRAKWVRPGFRPRDRG